MPKRLWSLTRRDMRLIVRNYYLVAVLVLALIYVAGIRFLMPAQIDISPSIVLWDQTASQVMRAALTAAGSPTGLIVVDSAAAFDEELAGANRIGVLAAGATDLESLELTYQGHESAQVRRLFEATLQSYAAALKGPGAGYRLFATEVLRSDLTAPKPPFNLTMVPIAVLTEATAVGMFLAASLLYSEKEERSLRAYRVTPGGTVEYLLARCIAMGLLATVFTILLTALTIGLSANWLVILPLVFFAAAVITALVMVLANLFDSIGQFIYPAIVTVTVLSLPAVAYFMPSFSPPAITILPSYPLVFAIREAYFPTGNSAIFVKAVGQLALTMAVVFPLAVLTFRRQLIVKDV